jgi:SAM-dependent methyltransferase
MTSNLPGFFQGTEMPNAGWWEALWSDPAGVLAAVGVRPGMEVIDLCSGDGWFTLQIAKIARHVVAIDIDPDLLEVARHRLTETGMANCDYVAGDAYELTELVPRPADFVFMANSFHGVPIGGDWPLRWAHHSSREVSSQSSTGISARARKQWSWANREGQKLN